LVLEVSVLLDQTRAGDKDAERLAAFLLPLAKNFGGETAFNVASGAVQVFGGAGYTREWPVEQLLRDARIITIYEGTTGIQAQDFLHRRVLRDKGDTLNLFLNRARADLKDCVDTAASAEASALLDRFEALSKALLKGDETLSAPDLAADGYLRAGWIAVSAVMACRLLGQAEMVHFGQFRLHQLSAEMSVAEAACQIPCSLIE